MPCHPNEQQNCTSKAGKTHNLHASFCKCKCAPEHSPQKRICACLGVSVCARLTARIQRSSTGKKGQAPYKINLSEFHDGDGVFSVCLVVHTGRSWSKSHGNKMITDNCHVFHSANEQRQQSAAKPESTFLSNLPQRRRKRFTGETKEMGNVLWKY